MRKQGARPIEPRIALSAIECVRYRGSRYGAGFAYFRLNGRSERRVKVFVDSKETLEKVQGMLSSGLRGRARLIGEEYRPNHGGFSSYVFAAEAPEEELRRLVSTINLELSRGSIRGRIYSWGRHVEVFKGIGYPTDVYSLYEMESRASSADLWLSHTRQPTNSPGRLPIWSHPFSSGEWAIVHNGDISSFGANMEFLASYGYRSFVGTDSEVIAFLLDHLTSVEGMNIETAAQLLCNAFEDDVEDPEWIRRAVRLRGARLDGPFTVVAGYCDGYDVYLLALTDRSKFRPIVVAEDSDYVYVASEEAEVREVSRDARVWTIEPGGYFLASMRRGLIHPGRRLYGRFITPQAAASPPYGDTVIDALGMGYRQLNEAIRAAAFSGAGCVDVVNVNGQRYIGVGVPHPLKIRIHGTAGNCLANFNEGLDVEVYGNAQDDVGDTMHGGSVVIHGDARDVLGQALQGGYIYVAGNAGNRCGIQMREYRDKRPCMIIGGRVDDYLGEYMAGGTLIVLGLNYLDTDEQIIGRFAATGMVGGRIYIRGMVEERRIGLHPSRRDIAQYLHGLLLDGYINEEQMRTALRTAEESPSSLKSALPAEAWGRIKKLFENRYFLPLVTERRTLDDTDFLLIGEHLRRFGQLFRKDELLKRVVREEFTIIYPLRRGGSDTRAGGETGNPP